MADEITQARHIGQIQPASRPRDPGARQRPRQPEKKPRDGQRKQRHPDGPSSNRVDEYV